MPDKNFKVICDVVQDQEKVEARYGDWNMANLVFRRSLQVIDAMCRLSNVAKPMIKEGDELHKVFHEAYVVLSKLMNVLKRKGGEGKTPGTRLPSRDCC